jgi:hypothetical protein
MLLKRYSPKSVPPARMFVKSPVGAPFAPLTAT